MPQGLKAALFAAPNVRAEALTYHSPRSIRVFQQILRPRVAIDRLKLTPENYCFGLGSGCGLVLVMSWPS